MTDQVNTLPAARTYAGRGIKVIPLKRWQEGGKVPTVEGGLTVATLDVEQINEWWSTRDEANVGIVTGAASGFWALDIDGDTGEASLAALVAEHGPLPETPEQSTGKGRHICFAHDPAHPLRNSTSKIGKNIDVRGDGGYIAAAPSRHHTGATYTWHAERRPSKMAFAQAPEWLIERAEKKPEKERPAPAPNSSPAPAKPGSKLITPYGETILREESAKIRAAAPGSQETTLNACAFNIGTIVGAGEISESIARAEMIDAGMSIARDWSALDVAQKVERAIQAGMLTPRVKPELPPRPSRPVREARTVSQEQPEQRTATIIDIKNPDIGYTPDTAWMLELERDGDGEVRGNLTLNAILMLTHHEECRGVFAHDTFANRIMVTRRPPRLPEDGTEWEPRELRDNDITLTLTWLEKHNFSLKAGAVYPAIIAAAETNPYNPAIDWLCEQKWDGTERLSKWLFYYMGAASNNPAKQDYIDTVGRKWLIGACARIMRPGCKMDTMLILEGGQGIGKSKAARILGTFGKQSYFTDELADIGSKDAAMQLQGVAIVELAELDKISKADVNTLKAWLTRTTDRYRPPYGKTVISAPRQSTLIGTMNPGGHGYLDDATGGRRFWPVLVANCDYDALAVVQPQLWAEALQAFRDGETWWLDDDAHLATAREEQGGRLMDEIWGEQIDRYALGKSQVRTDIIAGETCLNIPTGQQNLTTTKRIARHLTSRGWVRVRKRDPDNAGRMTYFFVRPSDAQQEELV